MAGVRWVAPKSKRSADAKGIAGGLPLAGVTGRAQLPVPIPEALAYPPAVELNRAAIANAAVLPIRRMPHTSRRSSAMSNNASQGEAN